VTLADVLLDASRRPLVIKDCAVFLDEEVAAKGGISGLAIKGGYKVIKKLKPGIIAEAFDSLLDDFAARLEPFFAESQAAGKRFSEFAPGRASDIAEALLGITDARAARAENRVMLKTYEKLRPFGKKNVEQAVPGIGRLIDKHASPA